MVFINIIFNRIPFFLTCKNDIGCFDNERDLLTVKDISNFIVFIIFQIFLLMQFKIIFCLNDIFKKKFIEMHFFIYLGVGIII